MERESFPFDVLVVGGGAAGLSAAIRLKQLAKAAARELEVGVVEKAPQCGLHCLSGAVFNPRSLEELIPDYKAKGAPLGAAVAWDGFYYLTATQSLKVPDFLVPPPNRNHGYVTLSIQKFVGWLAERAEEEGVTILTDTCGVEVLYDDTGAVRGVRTGDKGLGHDGRPLANHQAGYDLLASVTVFAEGPYGTLAEDLMHRKGMKSDAAIPQLYSLGVKEVIKGSPPAGAPRDQGFALHSLGFPMPGGAFGGGWLYHLGEGTYSVGYVLGLSWKNPALDLHAVFNEYKKHPLVQKYIRGGEVLTYGAKTIPEGGYFAVPRLHCDGALIVGDSAGLVNVRTLKGIHLAMKSGMLAAESAFDAVASDDASAARLASYRRKLDESFVMQDLWRDRNFRSSFDSGLHVGLVKSFLNDFLGGGSSTAHPASPDWKTLSRAGTQWKIPSYPGGDFDPATIKPKLTDVHLSGTGHREDQPSHIRILEPSHCADRCMPAHGGVAPCTHFCPAAVYELKPSTGGRWDEKGPIQVNFSNCVHCRTCVILDPCDVDGTDHVQNIDWRAPNEGGPRYLGL